MANTKSGDGIRVSIVLSAVFSASIAVLLFLGFYSRGIHGFLRFDSGSGGESRAQIAELIAAAPGRDEFIAVISSEFPSRLNSSAFATSPTAVRRANNELERGLARARAAIRKAANSTTTNSSVTIRKNNSDILLSKIYRNPVAFYRSYIEMEKRLKVFVYEEGELPLVHDGPCKDIYTSEGRFIHEMEHGNNRFRTRNAKAAHVYFMPFSVAWMVKYLYNPNTYEITPLKEFVSDYVKLVSTKHPFWNRTQGADHFMLSCHDWGPHATRGNPFLYNTSIRVLCNANSSEGFNPQKDVSLPEIHLYGGSINPKLRLPPKPNVARPYLAFFAGGVHGPVRPILLHYWKGRDEDIQVYEYLPKKEEYYDYMLQSKFCLCPSGYEVASPRIVEAVYAECIPVILSDHYVLPFSDVLRWEAFSIQVELHDIPRLKEILMAVSEEKYVELKNGLRAVRRHFVLNQPVDRFDVFHMILHSVWLRRLNLRFG
ncbi:probable glycosyltransferase At5g25310 [Henckelia pumila]|uniref:probable glycosyltransferase At5g25310 n=1 Tax=Henckelia pumila TaxID=405737 RepID=UPI003C6E7B6F